MPDPLTGERLTRYSLRGAYPATSSFADITVGELDIDDIYVTS
jgi:hypothetical protein